MGIPVGRYLRVRRLCSTTDEFKVEAKKLYWRFKERGYSHNSLKKAYNRALGTDRNTLLTPKKSTFPAANHKTKNIRVIGDYSKEHSEIIQILKRHWHISCQDTELEKVLAFSFHRQLTQSPYTNPIGETWLTNKFKRCHKCGDCVSCPFILKTTTFVKKIDNTQHTIEQFINCKTQGVVNMMKCKCGIEYVGNTIREFQRRVMELVGDVRHKRNTSVANHINTMHAGNIEMMRFFGIQKVLNSTRVGDLNRKLLQKEAKWIYTMASKAPYGLKGFTFTPFL
ncbi:hypothetical protein XELAEV_18020920mg [Xenopus laevis]|uniref:Uncharacterized protein n=1 Tax=Xenopus laevis TaxID=8355 RepID=A0A974DAP2_XENLA|nr:hypothetical protein XELAEV_18020920mg [Xenopus laevis]